MPPEVPQRLRGLRADTGGPSDAEDLWLHWYNHFNRPIRRERPVGRVRCDRCGDPVAEVREIGGNLILGVGDATRGFSLFHLLRGARTPEVGQASDPLPQSLTPDHGGAAPAQARAIFEKAINSKGEFSIKV